MTTNKIIRMSLRIPAWILLMIIVVTRMAIPYVKSEPIYLDSNDGYVIGGCVVVLLCIEVIKTAVNKYMNKKIG